MNPYLLTVDYFWKTMSKMRCCLYRTLNNKNVIQPNSSGHHIVLNFGYSKCRYIILIKMALFGCNFAVLVHIYLHFKLFNTSTLLHFRHHHHIYYALVNSRSSYDCPHLDRLH